MLPQQSTHPVCRKHVQIAMRRILAGALAASGSQAAVVKQAQHHASDAASALPVRQLPSAARQPHGLLMRGVPHGAYLRAADSR